MKVKSTTETFATSKWFAVILLVGVILMLFARSFLPDLVHFSNDGPLGQQNVAWIQLPDAATGMWDDLNDVGFAVGTFTPGVVALIKFVLGPVGYAKFLVPVALFIMGLGAWTFFRALKLSPLAALLGALAVMLSSSFFGGACWGVAGVEIALGLSFFALALICANYPETPWFIRWLRLALAGFCVGLNVTEAADVGALFSLVIAGFVLYKSLVEAGGNALSKTMRGCGRVAVVAGFAGFIAFQTIISLVGNSITGVAGTAQNGETKAKRWDFATQWSLPKTETLGLIVPGLFGYKMDTPNGMMPAVQDAYRGGLYWGGIGRDPANDRFFESGGQGSPPVPQWMRQTGQGNYCGILVALLAAWTIAQSFRRQNSVFSDSQKKIIWFWAVVLGVSLLLAWGRFAPLFYGALYQLPYFSTIRNPVKFLFIFAWAIAILFAFGVHALSQKQLAGTAQKTADFATQLSNWWSQASRFDRKWMQICVGLLGASGLGWLIFSSKSAVFITYLQKMGFPDETLAKEIAAFSIGSAGWFILLFAVALGLITLVMAGYFSGPRARLGSVLIGVFLLFDLIRADLPYIIHWDYKLKYEVGTLNPIEAKLCEKPYEQRVAYGIPFPLSTPSEYQWFDQIYKIEWTQHHFPYYNIQCLDIIQMPRMAEDLEAYLAQFRIRVLADSAGRPTVDPTSFPLVRRHWELSNTKYILGPSDMVGFLNGQFDSTQQRFHIIQRFDITLKPGFTQATRLEELTAVSSENGRYALIEFAGALPRAKLYSNWLVNTNDQANLKTLADLSFDPAKTVLISTPKKDLPAVATNENSGTVEFKRYAPKHLVLGANTVAPSVLLLNDKYDANWRVTVDGKPAELLRCNFLMRGVYLPSGGQHTVEFNFILPNKPLYITLTAFAIAFILASLLFCLPRKLSTPSEG